MGVSSSKPAMLAEGETREEHAYLWCPFRRHEGPSLDCLQSSLRQLVDKLDLGSDWYALLLVLQPVAWADLYDADEVGCRRGIPSAQWVSRSQTRSA